MRGYINAAKDFTHYEMGADPEDVLDASQIRQRSLVVAIPYNFSTDQWTAMYNAFVYGEEQDVSVRFLQFAG